MHSSTLLTALLALGLANAATIAKRDFPLVDLPTGKTADTAGLTSRQQRPQPAAPQPAAQTDPRCAQAAILAQGIMLNIADQQQELSTANQMAQMLQGGQVNQQQWAASRDDLLRFVNNGIAIREMNQLITPAGNTATAGVAKVANAQLEELNLATSLTPQGSDNVQGNAQVVRTLQMDFSGGIQQNMKNMADVSLDLFLECTLQRKSSVLTNILGNGRVRASRRRWSSDRPKQQHWSPQSYWKCQEACGLGGIDRY